MHANFIKLSVINFITSNSEIFLSNESFFEHSSNGTESDEQLLDCVLLKWHSSSTDQCLRLYLHTPLVMKPRRPLHPSAVRGLEPAPALRATRQDRSSGVGRRSFRKPTRPRRDRGVRPTADSHSLEHLRQNALSLPLQTQKSGGRPLRALRLPARQARYAQTPIVDTQRKTIVASNVILICSFKI